MSYLGVKCKTRSQPQETLEALAQKCYSPSQPHPPECSAGLCQNQHRSSLFNDALGDRPSFDSEKTFARILWRGRSCVAVSEVSCNMRAQVITSCNSPVQARQSHCRRRALIDIN